jgi:hypothetical protein
VLPDPMPAQGAPGEAYLAVGCYRIDYASAAPVLHDGGKRA